MKQLTPAVIALSLTFAACAQEQPVLDCTTLRAEPSSTVVGILNDGAGTATQRMAALIDTDPHAFFAAAHGPGAELGAIAITAYNTTGNVEELGVFDLSGLDSDDTRSRVTGDIHARCAVEVLTGQAPSTGGDLFRALPTAAALTQSATAGNGDSTLLVTGFDRVEGDGFVVAVADMSDEGRPAVLAQLDDLGLIPALANSDVDLRFVSPTETAASGSTATGINRFIPEMCAAMGKDETTCHGVEVFG